MEGLKIAAKATESGVKSRISVPRYVIRAAAQRNVEVTQEEAAVTVVLLQPLGRKKARNRRQVIVRVGAPRTTPHQQGRAAVEGYLHPLTPLR